ncbi:DivIVA domain-containing protein [Herbidospora cretacea]|uniref:DivIVA domain-containing protein n=1 Tax=Herbidospora cretacea TaxID=28444 RepID=UPI000B1284A7|nr:DivIVA domain-containing protein [Herbidospora cretacea]
MGHEHGHGTEVIPHLDPGMFTGDRGVLTPAEIHHMIFTTVRFRVGYNPREVDDFMARAEATVGALLRENGELRARLAQPARSGGDPVEGLREAYREMSGEVQRAIDRHRDQVQAIFTAR